MKYSINAQGVPEAFGPYSQGTTAGRLVFAAGQLPIAEGQTDVLVEGGITEQASRVIDLCERLGGRLLALRRRKDNRLPQGPH